MKRTRLLMLIVSLCFLSFGGCSSGPSSRDALSNTQKSAEVAEPEVYRYRYSGSYQGLGAKDVQVETKKDGRYLITATSDDSHVPAVISPEGKGTMPFPDIPGSKNIKITIDKEVGHTDYAGLRFGQEATINVWDNGTVEVDREGVWASDKSGVIWISKRIPLDDKESIVMITKS